MISVFILFCYSDHISIIYFHVIAIINTVEPFISRNHRVRGRATTSMIPTLQRKGAWIPQRPVVSLVRLVHMSAS